MVQELNALPSNIKLCMLYMYLYMYICVKTAPTGSGDKARNTNRLPGESDSITT